ncbi:MAG: hypothetical protein SFY80_08140 [Verrucomicrobiota bacterium]|nr:hypothetical protein [Verrucomicrobiota bacterium]
MTYSPASAFFLLPSAIFNPPSAFSHLPPAFPLCAFGLIQAWSVATVPSLSILGVVCTL